MQRQDVDEERLARKLSQGDSDALGRIYDLYSVRIYSYLRALGAAPSLADDVIQEVFVKLVRRTSARGAVRNLKPYLFAAARNELRRWSTKLLRRAEVHPGHLSGLFEAPAQGSAVDEAAAVEDALSKLPTRQREAVVMKVYGELTFAEIAQVMNTSINTAASRYRYGVEKLRQLLG